MNRICTGALADLGLGQASGGSEDARFMAVALRLGRRGLGQTAPNPAVGAVIVQQTPGGPRIVGRGWTQPGGRPHAEIEALTRAGSLARGATLFVTLEPCCHHGQSPPCTEAIIAAGVSTVVSAIEDPNPAVAGRGHARLRAAGIAVRTGVAAEPARWAHAGHIRRVREGRPYVLLKLALSSDGKVGLSGRRPWAITGAWGRERVHLMRSMNDAILIGIGTALADDPVLTCRLPGMSSRSPTRIVLDSELRLPLASQLVRTADSSPLWVIASHQADPQRERRLRQRGVEVFRTDDSSPGELDLRSTLRLLAARGITRLMVEGGPRIAAAVVKADVVDEIAVFHGQHPIGPDGIEPLEGLPADELRAPAGFCRVGSEPLAADTLECFVRV